MKNRNKKQKLKNILNDLKQINKTTKNYLDIKKLCEEYLNINNINEKDKKIKDLVSIPSLDYVIINLPKIQNSNKTFIKDVSDKITKTSKPKLVIKKSSKSKKLKIKENVYRRAY